MKRALILLGLLAVLLAGLLGGYALYVHHQGRDVRGSSTAEFVTSAPVAKPPPPKAKVQWPQYGFDPQRTRAVDLALRPPFREQWRWGGGSLLEFPPAIGYGRLYVATNKGRLVAVNARTGKRAWQFQSHRCVAASPALDDGLVFETFMNRPPCNARGGRGLDGMVAAFAVGFGHPKWKRTIGPSETSPLVANGLVYVGDWRGNVYAFAEHTGRMRWHFHTRGAVKGGAALSGKRLYVGSYDGHVYCLNARTGKLIWRAGSQPRLGHRGQFYATPVVAYGRVYVGATDGKMYSFGATTGKLRWSHHTGGFVYSSAAVWNGKVFVGSYDRRVYAFDAATGDVRWRFRADGPISGAVSVIGGVVYAATLKRHTYALTAAGGRRLWRFPDGKYTPVVADRDRLYLIGFARIYGMRPMRRKHS